MPTKLGRFIRDARLAKGIGLRELARRISKSPAFLVSLELAEELSGVSEDTLAAIAVELELNLDTVLALAEKVPQNLGPLSSAQVALYRLIKEMSVPEQENLRKELEEAALYRNRKAGSRLKNARGN